MKRFCLAQPPLSRSRPPRCGRHTAARPTPRLRAYTAPQWSTTGPASISAAISAARSRWQQPPGQRRPLPGRRAGRLRLSVRAQLGGRCRGPVQLAGATTMAACFSPAATLVTGNNDQLARSPAGSATPGARRCSMPRAVMPGATTTISASRRRRAGGVYHRWQSPGRLHRRRRSRIHVRAELVRQGRVPVLQFRQYHIHRRTAPPRRQPVSGTTSIPSRPA